MRRGGTIRNAIPLAVAISLACAGCDLPHGRVLVTVDTDLPAPRLAGVLRVDLHATDGRWYDSRTFIRPNADDWPATFSLYSDELEGAEILIRLRVSPQGRTRPYLGERFAERPTFVEPTIAKDLASLCGGAPEIVPGDVITLRRGTEPI